jgi:hypothetical protein
MLLNEWLKNKGQPSQGNIRLKLTTCYTLLCQRKPIAAKGCFKKDPTPISSLKENSLNTVASGYTVKV